MSNKNKKQTPREITFTDSLMFQQFPEIGKTICTLEANPCCFVRIADRLITGETDHLMFGVTECKDVCIKPYYTGIAKVNTADGDTYDAAEGREIAKTKAVAKFRRDMETKLNALLADLYKAAASVEHYMDKHAYSYDDVPNVSDIKMGKYRDAYLMKK